MKLQTADTVQTSRHGKWTVVSLHGTVGPEHEADVEEALMTANKRLILDLTRCERISSRILSVIVNAKRKCVERKGRLNIAVSEGKVKEILITTALDRIFNLCPSVEKAKI